MNQFKKKKKKKKKKSKKENKKNFLRSVNIDLIYGYL